MTLLSGGCYFWIPNFVCKRKEMSMTQLNIWENHGFFVVLLLHGAILPPCFWLGDLLSQLFMQCFEAFYEGNFIYVWNFYPASTLNPNSFKRPFLMFAVFALESTSNH